MGKTCKGNLLGVIDLERHTMKKQTYLGGLTYAVLLLAASCMSLQAQVNVQPLQDSGGIKQIEDMLEDAQKASVEPNGWLIALKMYGDIYRLAASAQNLWAQAESLSGIAEIEANFGNAPQKALPFYLEEVKIRTQLNDLQSLGRTYDKMGVFFEDKLYEPVSALGYYKQALRMQQLSRMPQTEMLPTLEHIIETHLYLKQIDSSVRYQVQKIEILQFQNDSILVFEALLALSESYLTAQNLGKAVQCAQEAKKYIGRDDGKNSQKLTEYINYLQNQKSKRNIDTSGSFWYYLIFLGAIIAAVIVLLLWKYKPLKIVQSSKK